MRRALRGAFKGLWPLAVTDPGPTTDPTPRENVPGLRGAAQNGER